MAKKAACMPLKVATMAKKAARMPLKVATMTKKAARVPLEATTLTKKVASAPVEATRVTRPTSTRKDPDAPSRAIHPGRPAGKVLMNRNAPDHLLDTTQTGYDDSKALIQKWHGRGRIIYAITLRLSPNQLQSAGEL